MAIFLGTVGNDTFTATAQADQFHVNSANDVIIGGNSQDRVVSYLSDYTLTAGLGSLILGAGAVNGFGNNLSNSIQGNDRDNIIGGGAGMDVLAGGAGSDTFLFSHAGQAHADSLLDFVPGVDRIAVQASSFGLVAGQKHAYALNTAATTSDPTFIRRGTLGTAQAIYFDADGIGSGKAQLLCTIPTFSGATDSSSFALV